jgi:hypothetical protein
MGDDARTSYDGVLELRIHGINNTSPASMLDLPQDSIEQVLGDSNASMWREKDGAQEKLVEGDRGWRPTALTREAYSWGGLARNTPDVPIGAAAAVGRAIGRVTWVLLLPFGIANVAYWTRRLNDPTAESDNTRGPGAGAARIFALGLTALTVVTACEASMDLVATQCYAGQIKRCQPLPSAFDVLAGREPALRIVFAAAVPLALLLVLRVLTTVTVARYERKVGSRYEATNPVDRPSPVILATPGFWAGDRMVSGLLQLHMAIAAAIIALSLSWPAAFGRGTECRTPRALLTSQCWDQVYAGNDRSDRVQGALVGLAALAALLLLLSMVVATRRSGDAPDLPQSPRSDDKDIVRTTKRRRAKLTGAVTLMTWLDLAATALLLVSFKPKIDDSVPLLGVSAIPVMIAAILLAIALSSLAARFGRWTPHLWLLFAPCLLLTAWKGAAAIVVVVVLALYAGWLAIARGSYRGPERRFTAWAGLGPGVFQGIALLATMMLASAVVLTLGDWLNGSHPASDLVHPRQTPAAHLVTLACGKKVCEQPDQQLLAPAPYVLFGVATLLAVIMLALLVGAMLLRTRTKTPAAAPGTPEDKDGDERPAVRAARKRARRLASRAQRGEKILGLLALWGFLAMVGVTLVSASDWKPPVAPALGNWWTWESLIPRSIDLGTLTVAGVGLAAVGALAGGKATGSARPLGLLWDLTCFLPRAVHPFGPPCYAERTVPELVDRAAWWTDVGAGAGKGQPGRRGDRVVLSAHSLGSVLAVATIFAMPTKGSAVGAERLSLITYGSQLRAYFGRIFPELLGSHVLGTPPVTAGRFWAIDPWAQELDLPSEARANRAGQEQADAEPDDLVSRLGGSPPRWVSLWRRTDYLGFPVYSYVPNRRGRKPTNQIDRPADETDQTAYLIEIATHGGYPRATAYRAAFDELLRRDGGSADRTRRASRGRRGDGFLRRLINRLRRFWGT